MGISYKQQAERVTVAELQERVAQAAVEVAYDVMMEDSATAGHQERAEFARQVLFSPQQMGRLMIRAVANHPAVGSGGTNDPAVDDDALKGVVELIWDAYAGVGIEVAQAATMAEPVVMTTSSAEAGLRRKLAEATEEPGESVVEPEETVWEKIKGGFRFS